MVIPNISRANNSINGLATRAVISTNGKFNWTYLADSVYNGRKWLSIGF